MADKKTERNLELCVQITKKDLHDDFSEAIRKLINNGMESTNEYERIRPTL